MGEIAAIIIGLVLFFVIAGGIMGWRKYYADKHLDNCQEKGVYRDDVNTFLHGNVRD
jgi:hypothetical protein